MQRAPRRETMKTSSYLFFLFLINVLVGASIVNNGPTVVMMQRVLSFLPLWIFALIGWGFVLSGLLCLLTLLIWSAFAQQFIPSLIIRGARILSLSLSLCVLCPWAMMASIETLFLHSAFLGAVIYLVMVWIEGKELKWPDLTPLMERRAADLFNQTRKRSISDQRRGS